MRNVLKLRKAQNYYRKILWIRKLWDSIFQLLNSLKSRLDFRWILLLASYDMNTLVHAMRAAILTVRLALSLKVPLKQIVYIFRGALLHDVGKVEIPSKIINKPGPLSDAERNIMREQSLIGHEKLKAINAHPLELEIAYSHHKRWDGKGYPDGLQKRKYLFQRAFSRLQMFGMP